MTHVPTGLEFRVCHGPLAGGFHDRVGLRCLGGRLHTELRRRVAALDTAGRAVIATDSDGRIVYWNHEAERLYGWRSDETLGRPVVDVTPSDLARREATEIMDVLGKGQPWSGEFLVRRRDGSRFTVHVTDIPIHDDGGNLIGIIGISRKVPYRDD